ncbi:MAG: penicillin-binding protein 2 [Pseudomonadales bacterium]|nr:penicillin-binding protein 2 [Pseudomonadales bacterium]
MKAWRHYLLVVVFFGACAGMAVRVVYLNVRDSDFLQGQGNARSIRTEPMPAFRGVIYDRHGEPLAVSTPVMSIWTDPSFVTLDVSAVEQLATILKLDPITLQMELRSDARREFYYLKRRATWQEYEDVRALGLDGVYFQREYRRYYPAGDTTAHVVGLTGVDDQGLEGVELTFNDQLRGQYGRKVVLKDRRGQIIKDLEYLEAPRFGKDLELSIDLRLQFIAHRELQAAIAARQASSGSIVMADARTGEILAMVNEPSYNPNDFSRSLGHGVRNQAITDTYEPGSTIKPFTVLAALASGRWEAGSMIPTAPGYYRVGSLLVQDPLNRGTISLNTALQKSSQVAIAKVALDLDPRAVYDVLTRIGIGEYMGVGLPGEAAGTLNDRGLNNPVVRTTLAYGYGLAISPLHLTQGYLAFASGGLRMPLTILKQPGPPRAERVIEESLAREVVEMMESVTAREGTAPGARVPGYRVSGKTGTSRKVGAQGYDETRHVALFAGLAPASDPRFVMVVVINEPKGEEVGGGAVSGPVFGQVAGRALRLLGVRPDAERAI